MKTKSSESNRRKWLYLRRISQIGFFFLFVLLFLQAEYHGQEQLAWPVDLFFRFDPLILAAHLLTLSPLVWGLLWSLVLVGLTVVLGRFFCGWVCPLGTALDGCRRLLFAPRPDYGSANRFRRVKYYLLFVQLAGTLFSLNLVGLFDPLSLLFRSLAIVFYPAFGYGVEKAGLTFYHWGAPFTYVSEPTYRFLKATVLPFKPLVYLLPFLTLILFALVVAGERVDRRFWCRALCPLGALYGLIARFSLLRRRPPVLCQDCQECAAVCKMGAFAEALRGEELEAAAPARPLFRHLTSECQLCLRCQDFCDKGRIAFRFGVKAPRAPLDLGRRQVIASMAAGAALVPLVRLGSLARRPNEFLIRPPGAQDEGDFLARCSRCGECLKVCLTNGLQPALWEAGLEGLYTSRLVPRMGYCAYTCTLCGQVCPTGAIPKLDLAVKQATPLGTAHVNRTRCIPYTEGTDCLVCEEHCPVSPKAITYNLLEVLDAQGRKVQVKGPVVHADRCIGCGHCEYVCPVGGEAAIRVKRSLRVES
jgi:MauM/NapG family ferredoxin protein|uniref:4Fe-4S dicluster domain-containing protein n=1 Tax=Desulfobacca acetoxidans TaxID=60893 RepID=A0A7C3UXP5_9BACT